MAAAIARRVAALLVTRPFDSALLLAAQVAARLVAQRRSPLNHSIVRCFEQGRSINVS
jgi:hypothetical protein